VADESTLRRNLPSGGPGLIDRLEAQRTLERRMFGRDSDAIVLSHYTLGEPLGRGSFGVVYAAVDARLGRKVALKLVQGRSADHQRRFLREAQALARLSHPHVVAIHDVGAFALTDDGDIRTLPVHGAAAGDGLFLVMEHVDGPTLRLWLAAAPRPWPQIIDVFCAAGRGLSAAHALGIVHRDFKPDNVLLGPGLAARVADFGLARAVAEPDERSASDPPIDRANTLAESLARSRTGQILGTPRYMAPEQLLAPRSVGPASDQFSFSVALFEALFAAPPFPGDTLDERMSAIARGELTRLPPDCPVPTRIYAALARALASDPALRFPAMDELLRALDTPTTDDSAVRASILEIAPGVILYHEVEVVTFHTVDVMRDELTRLTADRPYAMLVDLTRAHMPGLEIRGHLLRMFRDPNLVFTAVYTGGDPVKVLAATLVIGNTVPPGRFVTHDHWPAALDACRAALAGPTSEAPPVP